MKWIPALLLFGGCLSAQITVNDLLKCNRNTEVQHKEKEKQMVNYPHASSMAIGQEGWTLWLDKDEHDKIYVPDNADVHRGRGEYKVWVGYEDAALANIHVKRVAAGFLVDCAFGATVSAYGVDSADAGIPVVGMFNSLEPKKSVGKK